MNSTPDSPLPLATIAPAASPAPATGPDQEPAYHHRRTGFVARLPKSTRDKINVMLLDGVPYRNIIEALGDDGKHLEERHITSWAQGGHRDWLQDLNRQDALRSTRDAALDLLDQKAGTPVQDAGRTIAAAQLYELLLAFDPNSFAGALAEKPELYLRLISALSRLCEGEASTGHRRTQQALANLKLNPPDDATPANKLLTEEQLKEIARLIKLL